MKPVNLWIVLGMSLVLVTGALAAGATDKADPSQMQSIAGSVNIQPGTLFPIAPDVKREKSSDLLQIKLLKESRVREVGLQPQPDERDRVEQDILIDARPFEQGAIVVPE